MAKLTNKTEKTPLGIGALSLLIEPGQSVTVSMADLQKATKSRVVQFWVHSGMLEAVEGDDPAEAARLEAEREAEELRKLQEAERLAAEQKAAEEAERLAAEQETEAQKISPTPLRVPTPTRR